MDYSMNITFSQEFCCVCVKSWSYLVIKKAHNIPRRNEENKLKKNWRKRDYTIAKKTNGRVCEKITDNTEPN